MRRTSVMIEVDDEVYASVVEPLKRNKSFAKLISSLLNGYISDGYIRAFVDDGLEEVRKAVVGSFAESVGEMESVLANMGLFTDELNAHSQAGYSKFQQRRAEQAEELDKDPTAGRTQGGDAEFEALKDKVTGMEKTMTEGFNRILEMLSKAPQPVGNHDPVEVKPSVQDKASGILAGVSMGIVDPIPLVPTPKPEPKRELVAVGGRGSEVVEDEGESSGEETNAFLSSLVADFGASY